MLTPELPVIIIVGRPNVGKSALFNRLLQKRQALVDATPGLTRDRLYGDVTWRGVSFRIADTGGLQFLKENRLSRSMQEQVARAIEEAQLILFVCDAKDGLTPLDRQVADWLRVRGKAVLLVANKVDTEIQTSLAYEFSAFGMGDPIPVSSLHGRRVGELLDLIVDKLQQTGDVLERDSLALQSVPRQYVPAIKVAILGRPNVGKSSLVNCLLHEERVLVDDQPGTTRDPVDTYLTAENRLYCLIDTAGVRAKRRLKSRVDAVARIKALDVMERADVCLGVLDGSVGILQDDLKLLDRVVEAGKPLVIVVNKWDLVSGSIKCEEAAAQIARRAPFLRFAPVVCASAKTGFQVMETLQQAGKVGETACRRISPEEKRGLLKNLGADPRAPVNIRMSRILRLSQVGVAPPTFHLVVRAKRLWRDSDLAYLEQFFRRELRMVGTPIRIRLLRR